MDFGRIITTCAARTMIGTRSCRYTLQRRWRMLIVEILYLTNPRIRLLLLYENLHTTAITYSDWFKVDAVESSSQESSSQEMALQLQKELREQLTSLSESSRGEIPLDEAVIRALPQGMKAESAFSYGVSAWSFTAKVNATDANGQPTPFFLKYVAGELGKHQLEGEFTGMTELHKVAPRFVPKPVAWGQLKSSAQETYFFLIEFKKFGPGLPDPVLLGERLAAMHLQSASPNGKFGFPVQTFDGARLQYVGFEDKWTPFFAKLLDVAYNQAVETNGFWPELDIVYKRVQSHLIPRLIGALESDGRSVTPMLIHGDLWDGNLAVESETGDPWIFDCAAYYGHNEMELGIWRAQRHQLKAKAYRREYLRNCEPSEPEDEWDDRNRLYAAKTNFMHGACFVGSPSLQEAFHDMLYLVQKYVPWEPDSPVLAKVSLNKAPEEVSGTAIAV
ncbi:Fructosamine kinase-domain-containing protein [Xylariomycetidae sp. FL2044]|nr:Fructosamine kinase-domain-containing protein [Xylariomycetidae sp. FL2044]